MCGVMVCAVAQAEEQYAATCDTIESLLERQVEVLRDIRDESSAAELVPALKKCREEQKALFGVDESELWHYIDRTVEVKTALMRLLQKIVAETDRISKANCYGNQELRGLLY